jgi:hypothetical protein
MKTKLLVGLASVLAVGALSAAPAFASPRLWTDATETTLLRDVASPPKAQPDALEFVNDQPVVIQLSTATEEESPIFCNEVEIGTTVVANNRLIKEIVETKLAVPFGVAEGDECVQYFPGGVLTVPTYFDTSGNGAVKGTITITGGGPQFLATINKLRLSVNRAGVFCTVYLEGVQGVLSNVAEGFVEESPPNLNVGFEGPTLIKCPHAKKKSGYFAAHFFLETMSTTTDTAWVSP